MKVFYKTRATSTGGRTGHTALDDGSLAFDLASPGSGKEGANPEQLFALGYAACFGSALELIAKQMKLDVTAKTSVEVGIGQTASGGYALDIDIYAETTGITEDEAHRLIEKAHEVCPYSNATRGNIDVRLHVVVN
ncbi:organic hydroperoxide resistance protein [Ketogulonicigenium vulgare]|uniref:OsmC-like protein n=1 Tax=Ketogulonicigenium vulgare (strain WSH-001) TaxID=759362 RepID=F9Y7M2_KETVW|nr:organic hydroperoxide resistance protein [Ketogulonicigenium vulgare]ADO41463.1 OsmC-like protein [Ketogulonicigenium vulgare Y25]AEM42318.1 OsmC-like protein [Ketogulonicigenium vulgare WSH-001]ALJ79942.1 organic hydroperoxide resistance protein [Ketogulonicigenium vulgare]ANW32835.1 organic hydroperoxide resistance protein [Ketogulonicigenium vulgare]AOZ53398.1 OsmC-like protein [Ketogulonicigenium vulgare]